MSKKEAVIVWAILGSYIGHLCWHLFGGLI